MILATYFALKIIHNLLLYMFGYELAKPVANVCRVAINVLLTMDVCMFYDRMLALLLLILPPPPPPPPNTHNSCAHIGSKLCNLVKCADNPHLNCTRVKNECKCPSCADVPSKLVPELCTKTRYVYKQITTMHYIFYAKILDTFNYSGMFTRNPFFKSCLKTSKKKKLSL